MVVTVLGQEIELTPTKQRQMLIELIEMRYETGCYNQGLVGRPLSWYDWEQIAYLYKVIEEDLIIQGYGYYSRLLGEVIGKKEF